MYLQLTTRCNLNCLHCCFDCKPEGFDMAPDTYRAACRLLPRLSPLLILTIGGGEPTLHPRFWDCLLFAMRYVGKAVGVVTNGTRTRDACGLAALASEGLIGAELSLDGWHKRRPRQAVVDAFTNSGRPGDRRVIRKDHPAVVAKGRATFIEGALRDCCACEDLFVDPWGGIWTCSCCTDSLGTVFEPLFDKIPHSFLPGFPSHDLGKLLRTDLEAVA